MEAQSLSQFVRSMIAEADRIAPREWKNGGIMRMRLLIQRADGSSEWFQVDDEAYADAEHKVIWCSVALPALLVGEQAVRYGILAETWGLPHEASASYDEWLRCGHESMATHPARFEAIAAMAFDRSQSALAHNRIKRVGERGKRRLTTWRWATSRVSAVDGNYTLGVPFLLPLDGSAAAA